MSFYILTEYFKLYLISCYFIYIIAFSSELNIIHLVLYLAYSKVRQYPILTIIPIQLSNNRGVDFDSLLCASVFGKEKHSDKPISWISDARLVNYHPEVESLSPNTYTSVFR